MALNAFHQARCAPMGPVLLALALGACGGGEGPPQQRTAVQRAAAAAGTAATAAGTATDTPRAAGEVPVPTQLAPDRYDLALPDRVTVGSIVFEGVRYDDVLVMIGSLIAAGTGPQTRSYNHFDGATGRLTLATITVAGTTYTDVVLQAGPILSVGGASAVTPFVPNDPLFADQWHLRNVGQPGADGAAAKAGEDLNVGMAWTEATGTGIRIAVVDVELDIEHEDFRAVSGQSYDYRAGAYGTPGSDKASDNHGTACGGLAAARGHNGIGVTGVAFNASVVGYNLLASNSDSNGADALTRDRAENHVSTNSYGAADSNGLFHATNQLWTDAVETGLREGRGGRGLVYTWAAGNGAPEDRSDYDTQANFHGVMAIGALNSQGKRSSYSEPGANLLVMGFGGEFCSTQTTITLDVTGDRGSNDGAGRPDESGAVDYAGKPNYTRCMNGTSAATPEVAGVAALVLEANPQLGWRDVRAILARTARKNDPDNADWQRNGGGHLVNHEYGYGAADASAAVAAARSWTLLPPQKTASAALAGPLLAIPDAGSALVSELALNGSGIAKVEFVELLVDSDHPEVGDLEIALLSPTGTRSTVAVRHDCQDDKKATVPCGNPLAGGFRFGIARLMDEGADGTWKLALTDHRAGGSGSLVRWSLKVYGH
jgi:proprotein convertase subtilisin/kexin type 2